MCYNIDASKTNTERKVRMNYIRKLISVFLALCITVSCMTGLTMTVSAYDDPLIVVALGDSYSSGEGIEPFYGQEGTAAQKVADPDWLAHRSTKAWGGMLTLDGVTGTMAQNRGENWFFAAASGAETQHLTGSLTKTYNYGGLTGSSSLDPQLNVFTDNNLTGKVDYVTLTIGGNDIGFSDIMTTAFVEELFSQIPMSIFLLGTAFPEISSGKKTLSGSLTSARGQFDSIKTKLKTAYSQIETAAGKQAVIIVAGYPTLLSEKNYDANDDSAAAFTASLFYSDSAISINFPAKKAHEINEAVKDFNAVIKAAVDECAAGGMNIRFVSVADSFKGKEAYSDGELINGIMLKADGDQNIDVGQFISAYSFHPNASGAAAYAAAVQAEIDKLDNTYTVTFDSKGGTAVAPQSIVSGKKAAEPTAPTREGNAFGGWYDNENCTGDPFSFTNTAITADMTLYAKWTQAHSFTYSASGAVITAECSDAGCGLADSKATLTINAPENLIYDGTAKAAAITGDTDVLGIPAIAYKQGDTVLSDAPTEAGTYTASITVEGATASVEYTIAKQVKVKSVSLDKHTALVEMETKTTMTLTATVKPDNATDKTVTWTSDNTDVATVADGVITPVSVGTATITATAGDKSATCIVFVVKNRKDVIRDLDPKPEPIPTPGPRPVSVGTTDTTTPTTGSTTPTTGSTTPTTGSTAATADTTAAASDTTTAASDTGKQNNDNDKNLTATVIQNKVKLSWDKIPGAESYTVYIKKNGEWKELKTTANNSLNVIKLKNGKTYEFLIRYSVDGKLSEIADSYKVSANVYYKPAVKLTANKDSITIGWKSVPGAAKYKVYKYVNGKLKFVTETDNRSVRINGTKAGKKYSYAVKAYVNGKWTTVSTSDIATVKAK